MRKLNYQNRDAVRDMVQCSSFVAAAAITLILGVCLLFSTVSGSKSGIAQLQNRINPNEAPVASLIHLDGIGIVRASKIAAYREQQAGDGDVFKACGDLQKIKGIGPKTVAKLSKHLRFE